MRHLVSRWAGPALHALHCVPAVHPGGALEAGVGQVRALRLLDLARLAVFQSLPQQHRFLPLGLHLLLEGPQRLNQLLKIYGGGQTLQLQMQIF